MAANSLKRVPTGIQGFDDLIEGGLVEGSLTLITGTPGTAKTIFGLQYIANGAKEQGDRGVFITFEQSEESLCRQLTSFGYDMGSLLKKGLIKIIELESGMGADKDPFQQLMDKKLVADLKAFAPKRVVLDSISLLTNLSPSLPDDRKAVGEVAGFFKYLGATTMFTHERKTSAMGNLEYSMEEFLADGIVHLQLHMTENFLNRYLTVIKMRETNQSTGVYKFNLKEKGIYILRS